MATEAGQRGCGARLARLPRRRVALAVAVLLAAALLLVGPRPVAGQASPAADVVARSIAAALLNAPAVEVDGTIATSQGEQLTLTDLYITADGFGIGDIASAEGAGQILLTPGRLFFRGDAGFMKNGERPYEMGLAPQERVPQPEPTMPHESPADNRASPHYRAETLGIHTSVWVEASPAYLPSDVHQLVAPRVALMLSGASLGPDPGSVTIESERSSISAVTGTLTVVTVRLLPPETTLEPPPSASSEDAPAEPSPDETLVDVTISATGPTVFATEVAPSLSAAIATLNDAVSMRVQFFLDKAAMVCESGVCTIKAEVVLLRVDPAMSQYTVRYRFWFADEAQWLADCVMVTSAPVGQPFQVACSVPLPPGATWPLTGSMGGDVLPFAGGSGKAALADLVHRRDAEAAAYAAMPGHYTPSSGAVPSSEMGLWPAGVSYRLPSAKSPTGSVQTHGLRAGALTYAPEGPTRPDSASPQGMAHTYTYLVEPAIAQADASGGVPVRWCLPPDGVAETKTALADPSAYLAAARTAGIVRYGEMTSETLTDEQRAVLTASVEVVPNDDPRCRP